MFFDWGGGGTILLLSQYTPEDELDAHARPCLRWLPAQLQGSSRGVSVSGTVHMERFPELLAHDVIRNEIGEGKGGHY